MITEDELQGVRLELRQVKENNQTLEDTIREQKEQLQVRDDLLQELESREASDTRASHGRGALSLMLKADDFISITEHNKVLALADQRLIELQDALKEVDKLQEQLTQECELTTKLGNERQVLEIEYNKAKEKESKQRQKIAELTEDIEELTEENEVLNEEYDKLKQ